MEIMGVVEGIKKKFASPTSKLIRICTVTGNVDKLERLLAVNKGLDLRPIKVDGKTPLQLAVKNSYFYVIRHLVEQCAVNVDDLCQDGQTALHIACEHNLVDIASYLISVNAALEILDNSGKSPSHLCSSPDLKRLLEKALLKNILKNKGDGNIPSFYNARQSIAKPSNTTDTANNTASTSPADSPITVEVPTSSGIVSRADSPKPAESPIIVEALVSGNNSNSSATTTESSSTVESPSSGDISNPSESTVVAESQVRSDNNSRTDSHTDNPGDGEKSSDPPFEDTPTKMEKLMRKKPSDNSSTKRLETMTMRPASTKHLTNRHSLRAPIAPIKRILPPALKAPPSNFDQFDLDDFEGEGSPNVTPHPLAVYIDDFDEEEGEGGMEEEEKEGDREEEDKEKEGDREEKEGGMEEEEKEKEGEGEGVTDQSPGLTPEASPEVPSS